MWEMATDAERILRALVLADHEAIERHRGRILELAHRILPCS
jgi:hypothetical protein